MIEEFVGYQFYIWWWCIRHSSFFKDPLIEKGKESGEGVTEKWNLTAFETMGPIFYKASNLLQNTTKTSDRDHLCHTLRQNPEEEKNGNILF